VRSVNPEACGQRNMQSNEQDDDDHENDPER
jgi:hypothetical protein